MRPLPRRTGTRIQNGAILVDVTTHRHAMPLSDAMCKEIQGLRILHPAHNESYHHYKDRSINIYDHVMSRQLEIESAFPEIIVCVYIYIYISMYLKYHEQHFKWISLKITRHDLQ